MRVWVPGNPQDVVTAKYADFGTKVPVTAPPDAEPLPESLYALLSL
jgi:hypothetical protein